MAFDPDAYLSGGTAVKEFDPDAYLAADVPSLDPQVVTPEDETLSDRIKQFLFEPEGAKTLREGIQGAVEAIPHMAVDTAKMGYKGLRMAMGTPEERVKIMTEDVIPSALQQGQQTAADIQSPFGTPEWLRGATQIGMMAAPGLELARELRAPVEIPREIPPVQVEPTLAERITSPRVEPVVEESLAPVTPEVPPEPPAAAPQMPATVPEAVVPGPVAEAVPPAPVPVSPGALKQLGKLKAYVDKSKKLGQQVDPKVEAKIAEIEGVSSEGAAVSELRTKLGLGEPPTYPDMPAGEMEFTLTPEKIQNDIAQFEKLNSDYRRIWKVKHDAVTEANDKFIATLKAKGAGVPPEAPVQAQEAPSLTSEAPGGVPVAEKPPPPGAGVYDPRDKIVGVAIKKPNGEIVVGVNHPDARIKTEGGYDPAVVDGFLTASGKFLDRQQSLDQAMASRQLPKSLIEGIQKSKDPELYLEDTGANFEQQVKKFAKGLEASVFREVNEQAKTQEKPQAGAAATTQAGPQEVSNLRVRGTTDPLLVRDYAAVEPPQPGAGAPPVEVPPSERGYAGMEPLPTSTKNVVTAAEREARGIPPAEEAAARDFGTVWDESAKDTAAPARLVASLKVEPRALSDVENAHLLRRQIELQTEHETMTKAVNEAADPAVATEAKQRLETVRNDLQDVYDVGKAAGTETGRGLNARKMLADQDYALSNMEATTRALVNDGKPLSNAQISEVAKLHERIRTAEDKLAAYESQEIFNQSLKEQPRRPVLSFLDEQAVKARERINARKNRLYADPLGVTQVAHLADEAIIGASHIARGVTKFADWSAKMVSEFGDRIKPYLAALFEKSKQQFKNASAGLKKAPVTYAEREARALAGEKKGIITRTEKLIGRTEVVEAEHPFGEFEPLKRRAPRMDPEKAQLQYQYRKAKEAFDRGIYEAELKKRSVPERILGTAREVLNMPRSLLASADFSAVRRQGGIYTMIHPLRARHAFRAMLEATKSEQGYFKVMQEIRDRPNAAEYQRYGLELTDIGPVTRAKMEEQFQSRWAGKIPGISHSQRAYTGFLNRARADWFDLLKDSLAKKGEPLTPKQGKAIANAVNVFTGRGAMNQKWIGAMTALNDVFFAPRWRASRFQTLIGQPLWKNSGARGVIAKEYAKALIGYGSILTLIGWATKNTLHPMEKNPVSTEAGKLRVGNTRVDFLQGLQQPTVLLSRLLSGRTKTAAGNVEKIYGDVPLGKTTSSDIITRFLRSSLAPVPGGVWNVLEGKNVIGEPVTLPSTVRDLTIPLLGKDIYDAIKEQGVPTGTALGLLALFGDGIQTYSPRVSTKAPKREPSVSQRIKAAKAKRTRERKKEREE